MGRGNGQQGSKSDGTTNLSGRVDGRRQDQRRGSTPLVDKVTGTKDTPALNVKIAPAIPMQNVWLSTVSSKALHAGRRDQGTDHQ